MLQMWQKGQKMKNVMERLNDEVLVKGPLLAGLDPDMDKLKVLSDAIGYKGAACDFLRNYCFEYIEAVKDTVAAIKVNIAFFEAYALLPTFWEVLDKAKSNGLIVIADVKRADIGNTSAKYAEAFLYEDSPIDFITINPYFGTDGVQPFLDLAKKNDKGVFVLTKTSNKSAAEFQDILTSDGEYVYEKVGRRTEKWGMSISEEIARYTPVGAVVGATHPVHAKVLRNMLITTFFLVPGYGAQGAEADDIVVNFDSHGGGAIVNSSRGLMFAYNKTDKYSANQWAQATADEAVRAQKELTDAVQKYIRFIRK